jgi:hypothetical protein
VSVSTDPCKLLSRYSFIQVVVVAHIDVQPKLIYRFREVENIASDRNVQMIGIDLGSTQLETREWTATILIPKCRDIPTDRAIQTITAFLFVIPMRFPFEFLDCELNRTSKP